MYGVANQAAAKGVSGYNNVRHSRRDLGTGTAGVEAIQGTAPLALNVVGKAHFARSGAATIPSGQRFVKVDVPQHTNHSPAFATLQQYRADLWVQSITASARDEDIYIYVSQRAPSDTRVAWTVFD